MTENTTPLSNKELFGKLVPIFTEILSLEEDAKALKDDADDADLNYAAVAALAKAKARSKLDSVEEKAQATLDLIEELMQ